MENEKEKIDTEAQLAAISARLAVEMDAIMKRARVIVLQYEQRLAESVEKKDQGKQ